MAQPEPFSPVQCFFAMLYVNSDLCDRALSVIETRLGTLSHRFGPIPFTFTDYYDAEMGKPALRMLVQMRELVSPIQLADMKIETNRIEMEIAQGTGFVRPVNIDPGYIDRYKLVLASCKNGPMRIPLKDGVYAEVTMTWRKDGFTAHDLTYADYRSDEIRGFLAQIRQDYLKKLKDLRNSST